MSRFHEYDGDGDDYANGGDLWTKRAELALRGRRGRQALADLREAMLALPEKRLISRALCTVGGEERIEREVASTPDWYYNRAEKMESDRADLRELVEEQGPGVCAMGAYLWWKNVKAGMDPAAAFDALPTVADTDGGGDQETAALGRKAGLTFTLAWQLAEKNDAEWDLGGLTPERRYLAFMAWIDAELARPPLTRPARRVKRIRQPKDTVDHRPRAETVPLGLVL